ncbi:DNA helicase MCM9 [Leuresthes tenuis]|uniref:DNA helicase MCM9 n=1 Tax=Leuresthes tenuis TaxID=355514 RepID=UPI003B503564
MLISPEQKALIGRVFESYLTEHHHDDILQFIADTNEETHHPVVVNAMTLFEANMEVGDFFNAYPNDVLAIFDEVLQKKAMELSDDASSKHQGEQRSKGPRMRQILHARITGLPVCPELTRHTIPRSRDVGHFLSVTGTVIRTSVAKVLEYERDYMCTKCRHVFNAQADFDQFYTFVPPVSCTSPVGCNSYKFSCLSDGSEPAACRDYQEIKIQEQVQRLSVGSIPRSLVVVLEDDLVDSCKSGDDITVYGVMCLRWKPFYDGTRCDVELVLKANNIEVNNQHAAAALLVKDVQKEFEDFWNSYRHDPIAGRNQILLSLCPQVFGMYVIKLAVAMVLAGGVQRIDSSGTKIRGECHMLLVGDPGTGKSQFLKYAAKIVSRSVLTAGIGSTSAGLTVAAVKDGGDWHLEAGALVLSDGGLCCIDEFNSIKEHDRISIHEAMEQQSISVAKAGMVCKLNTRTTILAATNPKGQYDSNEPLSVNVALASPLLSRFDLVLVLLDTRNPEWDRIISSFILEDRGLPAESSGLWSMEKMKAYFSVIKQFQPHVTEQANCILSRYYQLQRQSDGRNAARTTIRMLESLSRLAEAHARLMYRETVTIEDAVIAVSVMECSMQGGALLGNVNALLTSFPADPVQQYQTQCQKVLEGLNLPLLLQNEMDRLDRLRSSTSEASDPPAADHQHQLSSTNSDKTQSSDITSDLTSSVTVESGLDRFHTSSPSLSLQDANLSMITLTQDTLNRNVNSGWSGMPTATKQPSCQADVLSNVSSMLNHDVIPYPLEIITFCSEEADKSENINKRLPQTLEEIQKDATHPQLFGCGGQRLSKDLTDKRVQQLVLSQQQRDEETIGGHAERRVCEDAASTTMNDALDAVSDRFHPSNTPALDSFHPPSIPGQDNRSTNTDSGLEKKDEKGLTGLKNISAVLRAKMEAKAETHSVLHARLSGFMFKPRKMRPVHSHNITANSEELMNTQKAVSHDDSASPLPHARKRKWMQSTDDTLSEVSRGKEVHLVSDVGDKGAKATMASAVFTKDEGLKSDTEGEKNTGTGNLCQQRSTVNTSDEKVDTCTGSSTFSPSFKSGQIKTVACSAATKLSRFSFTCTNEPATTAQTKGGKSPFKRNGMGGLRANSRIKEALNSSKGKGTKTTACPVPKLPAGEDQGPGSPTRPKQAGPPHVPDHGVPQVNRGPDNGESTASLKKRRCFRLSPPPKTLPSAPSLFSSTEVCNDVLDTDWDQEILKTAKV